MPNHELRVLLQDSKQVDAQRAYAEGVLRESDVADGARGAHFTSGVFRANPTNEPILGKRRSCERLPAEVQVVFISVVFNRGASMGGDPDWRTAKEVDRRWEMRRLRADVEDADMFAIYAHLGTMKRIWETSGPRGLALRRRDEQALIRPYVNQQLRWDENRERLKKEGLPPCPD